MRRFVFVGFDSWLDYSPGSGSYDLHRCDHERWQRGAPLLCARLCGGRLANPNPDPNPEQASMNLKGELSGKRLLQAMGAIPVPS